MTPKSIDQDFDAFKQKWLPIMEEQCPEFIAKRIGPERLSALMHHDLYEDYDRLTTADWALDFHAYIALPDTSLEDFQYRLIETPLGQMVTSIRYIGGDKTKPAVFILHNDFPIENIQTIELLTVLIRESYAVFKPQRIRWFSSAMESELIEKHIILNGDLMYVSNFLGKISNNDSTPPPKGFRMEAATDLWWYDQYHDDFSKLLEERPNFAEIAQIESRETMELMLNSKSLFLAYLDHDWIGVIGALPLTQKYFSGYEVYEEYLLHSHRNKGLAKYMQQHLINQLDASEHNMLYGTIHYNNLPSYRTALSCGRKFCGMYVMADIA